MLLEDELFFLFLFQVMCNKNNVSDNTLKIISSKISQMLNCKNLLT